LKRFYESADSSTVETGEVAMKVEVNSTVASQLPPSRGAKPVSSQNLAATQSSTEDRTTFHSDDTSVQALTSLAMNTPEVRQEKVDALTQSVKSGEYQVDAAKTANAIFESGDA
jgi:flagellar biosynthesis anti-sigma factor FlgM